MVAQHTFIGAENEDSLPFRMLKIKQFWNPVARSEQFFQSHFQFNVCVPLNGILFCSVLSVLLDISGAKMKGEGKRR